MSIFNEIHSFPLYVLFSPDLHLRLAFAVALHQLDYDVRNDLLPVFPVVLIQLTERVAAFHRWNCAWTQNKESAIRSAQTMPSLLMEEKDSEDFALELLDSILERTLFEVEEWEVTDKRMTTNVLSHPPSPDNPLWLRCDV